MTDVVDEQRYQFLRELVWAVVVGAVGHDGGQAVGVVEGAYEVVAAGLGGAVGAMGLVFQVLGEELVAIGEMVLTRGCLGGEGGMMPSGWVNCRAP